MGTQLTLGGFTFQNHEIPATINFGGEQKLYIHELVGGSRVIDSMGRSDAEITWSGMFWGKDALSRAQSIDGMRISGGSQTLTWSEFSFDVVIKSFAADFERYYQIPYHITCVVAADNSNPLSIASLLGITDTILQDLNVANGLGGLINDPTLNLNMSGLTTAINNVGPFESAAQSTLNSVKGPLAAAQAQVSSLITSVSTRGLGAV